MPEMTPEQHAKIATQLKTKITKAKTAVRDAGTLAEKIELKKKVAALEEQLRQHKLDFFELTTDQPEPSVTLAPTKAKELMKQVLYHRHLYYSGHPEITDDAYDTLEEQLRQQGPQNEILGLTGSRLDQVDPAVLSRAGLTTWAAATLKELTTRLGEKVSSQGKIKVEKVEVDLPVPMPSLAKIRPDNGADAWLAAHSGPYVASDKLDGVSIELVYYPKQRVQAYTRGDGRRGGDISYLCEHMDIPQTLPKKMVIRGEIIMDRSTFDSKWSSTYKNARNLAAGLTNRKDVHDAVPDLHVVVYSVLSPRGQPSTQLAQLKTMGFRVVPHKVYAKLAVAQLQALFTKRKQGSKYEIDGIVVEQDIKTPVPTDIPGHAVAFKDILAVDNAQVTVTKVTWEDSRYGKLTPRIWFDPVRLSGVDVQKCTAHNAGVIRDSKIGPGALIEVVRSGDVIPYLVKVIKPARKASMPEGREGIDWEWNDSGVDIFIHKEKGLSDTSQIRQLEHFFVTMGVDGLRGGTLSKLYDAGFDTVNRIMRAKPAEYAPVIGPNNAQKIGANIREQLKYVYPADLAYAWGGFGRGVGSKKLWAIWLGLGNAGVAALAKKSSSVIEKEVKGFTGPAAAGLIAPKLADFFTFAKELPSKLVEYEEEEVELKSTKLNGEVVCFTGFRDADLAADIVANGGEASDNMTKTVTLLLTKDPSSNSGKVKAARDKGIPVMTPDQFRKRYKV